jgi:hypothetical protein
MIDAIVNMIDQVRRFGLEKVFNRYYSLYRAKVVDNKDPKKRGRIKVLVPALFGEIELPQWCLPRDFRATAKDGGEFYPPEIDDYVFVEFEGGDPQFPVYSGGWFGETAEGEELPEDFVHEEDAPMVKGFKDRAGNTILFDQTEGKEKVTIQTKNHYLILDETADAEAVYLAHKLGSQLQIDKSGSMKMFTSDGHYISMDNEGGAISVGSKDGAIVSLKEAITVSDASGKSVVNIKEGGVQITTGGDLVAQSNTATIKTGSLAVDAGSIEMQYKQTCEIKGAGTETISMGTGQIAIKGPTAEVVDILLQTLEGLMTDATPGYGGPLVNMPKYAALYALLTPLKKVG